MESESGVCVGSIATGEAEDRTCPIYSGCAFLCHLDQIRSRGCRSMRPLVRMWRVIAVDLTRAAGVAEAHVMPLDLAAQHLRICHL